MAFPRERSENSLSFSINAVYFRAVRDARTLLCFFAQNPLSIMLPYFYLTGKKSYAVVPF